MQFDKDAYEAERLARKAERLAKEKAWELERAYATLAKHGEDIATIRKEHAEYRALLSNLETLGNIDEDDDEEEEEDDDDDDLDEFTTFTMAPARAAAAPEPEPTPAATPANVFRYSKADLRDPEKGPALQAQLNAAYRNPRISVKPEP